MSDHARWCQELRPTEVYFVLGFVDRWCSAPHIATYVYLGEDIATANAPELHRFQDAQTYFDGANANAEPDYLLLQNENLDMIADRAGLIEWLQSVDSTSDAAT